MGHVRRALILLFAISSIAHAQSSEDKAAADALYEAGKKAFDAGNYAEACPKFQDSQRLDRGIGTALYLGDCWQRVGKIASAVKAFREALDLAKAQNDKRVAVAQKFLDKLRPSKITIVAPDIPGLKIERDGALVDPGTLVLDGGKHAIHATAPDRQPFDKVVDLANEGGDVTVTIDLAPVGTPKQPEQQDHVVTRAPPPEEKSNGAPMRILGITSASVGAVGIVIGSVCGVMALDAWNQSNDPNVGRCNPNSEACLAQKGVDLRAQANGLGAASTGAIIAGSILVVGGAALFLFAPSAKKNVTANGFMLAF